MNQRGRKSAASLAVVSISDGRSRRPNAPAELSPSAQVVWTAIVAARAESYFDPGAQAVLSALCVAKAEHVRAAGALAATNPVDDTERYGKLARVVDSLAGRIGDLSTKLRLTSQSQTDSRAAARAVTASGRKPWEVDDDTDRLFGKRA